jgi:general secretion pathway protein N
MAPRLKTAHDPPRMKKIWRLVALGVVAYLLFALTTLPARIVVAPLAARGIHMNGVTGTVWNGAAQVVQIGRVGLGSIRWDLHTLSLFLGRAVADVKVTRVDGFAQATVTATPAGRISFSDLTASLPLSTLPSTIAPGGWNGKLNIKLPTLVLVNRWPISAAGTVEILDLLGPARRPAAMGSYKLTFPEKASPDVLAGALTDSGGPLQIAGTLELKAADRSYVVNGLVSTRPDAPKDLVNTLQFLGPPDAQGRRPISLAGTM